MTILLILSQIDSLSLEEAIDVALFKSPTYYESKVSLDKSRIQFYQTLSNLPPTFSATAQYTEYESDGFGLNPYSCRFLFLTPWTVSCAAIADFF